MAKKSENIVFQGTGRRKESIARVRLMAGKGNVTVNGKTLDEYFGTEILKVIVNQPFAVTNTVGKYDVVVKVVGGGYTGQAGAIRHGIARALNKANAEFRPALKAAGFLTRDPRMKETSARVMMEKTPEKAMFVAVKGMLPHTRLGRQMIKKLRVYAGSEHENAAQKPEVWEVK